MGDDYDFSLISEDSIKSIRLKDNAQMFENSIEFREEFWKNNAEVMTLENYSNYLFNNVSPVFENSELSVKLLVKKIFQKVVQLL